MVLTWHQNMSVLPEAIADFEALVSRIAGVGVRRLAAINERVIAIGLECGSPAACESASRSLRADPRVVDLVVDNRVTRHGATPPPPRSY